MCVNIGEMQMSVNWTKNWKSTYQMSPLAIFVYLLQSECLKNSDPPPFIPFVSVNLQKTRTNANI